MPYPKGVPRNPKTGKADHKGSNGGTHPAVIAQGARSKQEHKEQAELTDKVVNLTKGSDMMTIYAVAVWVLQHMHVATPQMVLDFMAKNLKAKVQNLRVLQQALEALRSGNILSSVDNYQTDSGLARAYQIRKDAALPGFTVPDRASLVQIRDELDNSNFARAIKTLMTDTSGKKAKGTWTPDVQLDFELTLRSEQYILGGQPVAEHIAEKTKAAEKEGQATTQLRFNRVIRNGQLHVVIRADHIRGWLRDNFRDAGISDFYAKRVAVPDVLVPIENTDKGHKGAKLIQMPIAGARVDARTGMKVGTGITLYEALEPGIQFTIRVGIPQKTVGAPDTFLQHLVYRSSTGRWVTGIGARALGFGRLKLVAFKYHGTSLKIADLVSELDQEDPLVKSVREFSEQFRADLAKKGAQAMGLSPTLVVPKTGAEAPADSASSEESDE